MDDLAKYRLKQPCINRGLSFVDNHDGKSITINNVKFTSADKAEIYLENIPRTDFLRKDK